MITNKDIRVENGSLIINGDPYPLDGQSPETIMGIVEDNSDSTPTENSTAPVTSGGVYTALGTKQDTLTFDDTPTENSTKPVKSGGVFTADKAISDTIGDITQTGITGATVAAQLENLSKVTTGDVTLDTTQSTAVKSLSIRQCGHVVSIQGYISGLVLSSGSVVIGTLTGVERPPVSLRLVANSTTQAWTYGETIYANIDTDGSISVKPNTTTNTVISFSITYIAGTVS